MVFIQDTPNSSNLDEYSTDYGSDASDHLGVPTSLSNDQSPLPTSESHPRRRANARRKKEQRQRLFHYFIHALRQEEPFVQNQASASASRRHPRLVLLGNERSLILGVVLSDRGAVAAANVVVRVEPTTGPRHS
jgi:hypothetical protein